MQYQAPPWLPGGHAQTIWPVLFARRFDGAAPRFRRERWDTPDGDFVDVEWLIDGEPDTSQDPADGPERPLLVLFHGLEGSVDSQYVQAFAAVARRRGWAFAMPYFRGCSGRSTSPRAPTTRGITPRSVGC